MKDNIIESETALDFFSAAAEGNADAVEKLLKEGTDVNAQNNAEYEEGMTALMYAAQNGHLAAVKRLLEAGADVNAQDEYGQTALMNAAKNGHFAVVEQLLEAGANRETEDERGNTAASLANEESNFEISCLLRDLVCPFCSSTVVEGCSHYLGGGDRGNGDEINDELGSIGYALSKAVQRLDDSAFERFVAAAPAELVEIVELASEYEKYFWTQMGEVARVSDDENYYDCNEDYYHTDREAFIERVNSDSQKCLDLLESMFPKAKAKRRKQRFVLVDPPPPQAEK